MRGTFPAEYFDVRFRIPMAEVSLVWPPQFVILTAWATTGEVWTDERNREADSSLRRWCAAGGLSYRRITGYSQEISHAEPGWAITMDVSVACRLGCRFRQRALYQVQDDSLWVITCAEPSRRQYVGSFRSRLAGGNS